jgi:hypothetical protein
MAALYEKPLTADEVSVMISDGVENYKKSMKKAEEEGMANIEDTFRKEHSKYHKFVRDYIENQLKERIQNAKIYGKYSCDVSTYNLHYIMTEKVSWMHMMKYFVNCETLTFSYPIPGGKETKVRFNPFEKYGLKPIFDILREEYEGRGFEVSQTAENRQTGITIGFDIKKIEPYHYMTIYWK